MKVLLVDFNLTSKVIMYVKDEGTNLNSFTIALTFVVSCEPLQLFQQFVGFCIGHVMSKACQYATNEVKVGVNMKKINLKDVQVVLQKTITWTKKSKKDKHEWEKACHEANLLHKKFKTSKKTHFASKAILFKETLEYVNVINLCYIQQSSATQAGPSGFTWAIA
jgi:hypothetical protein